MALPLPPGLVPPEVAFLCEMELVTVVPRQRLDPIPLLSGLTPALRPPRRADLPLWLALLLKKQRRANIVPPPWLLPDSLRDILHYETKIDPVEFSPPPPPPVQGSSTGAATHPLTSASGLLLSPPFLPSNTASAPSHHLPYHWFELGELLLAQAGDDVAPGGVGEIRALLKDLQEARAAKMRGGTAQLGGEGGALGVMTMRGVGAMELAENRAFVVGVVDGVRKIGASGEEKRREEGESGMGGDDDDDEDLL